MRLFLACVALASSIATCDAQTAPPPVPPDAFRNTKHTVATPLATQFSLGEFVVRMEETRLDAVRDAVGGGTVAHQGDAGESIYWLCYRNSRRNLWIVSDGEMGGREHRVTEVVEELVSKDSGASVDCPEIAKKFEPVVLDRGICLGMTRKQAITALGPPSKSDGAWLIYSHLGRLENGFDEAGWLLLAFRGGRIAFMRGGKTTTN